MGQGAVSYRFLRSPGILLFSFKTFKKRENEKRVGLEMVEKEDIWEKIIPVEEGETYELEIVGEGEEGDGIAKIDDFVIFVPDTDPGDEVKVKINRVLKSYAFGEVVEE